MKTKDGWLFPNGEIVKFNTGRKVPLTVKSKDAGKFHWCLRNGKIIRPAGRPVCIYEPLPLY